MRTGKLWRPPPRESGEGPRLEATLDRLLQINDRIRRSLVDDAERYLLQALIDQIPDFIFVKDVESRFIIANDAIEKVYGVARNGLTGLTDFDLHPEERARAFFDYEQEIMRSGKQMLNIEESFPDSGGVQRWYSTTKVPLRTIANDVVGLIGVARDITERKLKQSFESQQASILAMIATSADLNRVLADIVLLIESQVGGARGSVLLFDAVSGRLRHGVAPNVPEAFCRAVDGVLIGPGAGPRGPAAHAAASSRNPGAVADITVDPAWKGFRDLARRFDLRPSWSTPILAHDARVLGTFALYSSEVRRLGEDEIRLIEIATRLAGIAIERHQAELQLVHMAHYDALTRLPNRVLFLERLTTALAHRRVKGLRVALLYIDLDGFKQINDHLGHLYGDLLLSTVGDRLRTFESGQITISRLGGDEFAVIQTFSADDPHEKSAALASDIIAALAVPFDIRSHRVVAGATIGIAFAPQDGDEPDTLLRDADLALYQAKAEQKGGFRFFELAMNTRAQERHSLEIDLRRALESDEFEIYYQPLVDLASESVCGFEALLRWHHSRRGLVPPQDFIPMAEELGLIIPMGEWILGRACMEATRWPSPLKIAVNLSPVQFSGNHLLEAVKSALQCSGLSPDRLELEITESVVLMDNVANLQLLHQLRSLGVQISLDDFGTGYSSLSYLRSFPFTKIKIDRSFVGDLERNPGCLAIIRAVASLASDLGMTTTAEGIETRQQLMQLRREGCHQGQGSLFSAPVPAGTLSGFFEGARKRPWSM